MTEEQDRAMALGDLIKEARDRAGLSIRQAAKEAGISEGRWRQLERGYQQVAAGVRVPARPRVDTLSAIANAVKAEPLALFDAAGIPLSPEARASFANKPVGLSAQAELPKIGIEELARRTARAAEDLAIYAKELSRRVHYQHVPDTTPMTNGLLSMAAFAERHLHGDPSIGAADAPATTEADVDLDAGRPEDYDLARREGVDERPQHPDEPA